MTTTMPTGRRLGYGRVSTQHQSEEQQKAALKAAGCDLIRTETISSGNKNRPVLAEVMADLQPGDTLVITKIDRWARSLKELLNMSSDLNERGVNLHVLDQNIDTSTPTGRLMFSILGSISEFEREMAIERTRDSVEARRQSKGNLGGRKPKASPYQIEQSVKMHREGYSVRAIAEAHKLKPTTVHRLLKKHA